MIEQTIASGVWTPSCKFSSTKSGHKTAVEICIEVDKLSTNTYTKLTLLAKGTYRGGIISSLRRNSLMANTVATYGIKPLVNEAVRFRTTRMIYRVVAQGDAH